jgi:hypothetical protein
VVVIAWAQSPEIESDAATGIAQLFAMTAGTVVGIESLAYRDVDRFGSQARQGARERGAQESEQMEQHFSCIKELSADRR